LSLRKLALKYGISAMSASRLVNGAVAPDAHVGPKEVLPPAVEAELVAGLKRCIANACAVNMTKFPTIVKSITSRLGVDTPTFTAGKNGFARNPELAKRLPSKTNQARLVHFNRISVAEWCAAVGPLAKTFSAKETTNMDDTSFDNETVVGKVRTP
jgi:hypothetical protein